MPTTPGGIWTPDDNDDWDLTVDLAAMAVSIDDSVQSYVDSAILSIQESLDKLPASIESGSVAVTSTAANTTTSQFVPFPPGAFMTPPNVTVTANSTVPGNILQGVSVTGVSSTGFTIHLLRENATTTTVYWIAVEN